MSKGLYDIPSWATIETRTLAKLAGVERLFEPQYMALQAGVEKGENLVVAAPTGSGKTFIALVAIVNSLARAGGRAFYLVPLKSVAYEKYTSFSILERMGLKLKISVGDFREGPPEAPVVIATYEKFDSLLRVSPSLARDVSVLIVDEIHSVSDPKRGPILESIVSRMLASAGEAQIVGLSATVPNAGEIAEWIGGKIVESSWRPVPLREYVFKEYKLYSPTGDLREVPRVYGLYDLDLAAEAIEDGGQALVFTYSRRRAVTLAKRAAKRLGRRLSSREARGYSAEASRAEGAPRSVAEELASLIAAGVAYHHAGLPPSLRRTVEEAFRAGAVKVVYSTPTLAAGVNLPARRVVIDSYYRYEAGFREPIRVAEYKQMAGRAGRPGLDEFGEAIIVAERLDRPEDLISGYIRAPPERVESRLAGLRGLRHFILGIVAPEGEVSIGSIEKVSGLTLYSLQRGLPRETIARAIEDLSLWGLVEVKGRRIAATSLGREVAAVYLDPESVPVFREEARHLSFDNEFDILYLISTMPDMVRLPATRREEERLLEAILDASPRMLSSVDWLGPEEMAAVKTAVVLKLWIDEASEDTIYGEWGVHTGDLLNMVSTAEWIASGLSRIAPYLGLNSKVSNTLSVIARRIKHGVKPELLQLVEIPGVGRVRARILFEAGYRSIEDLATARAEDLIRLPLIGPSTARQILEFLGRADEAREAQAREMLARKGLLSYLEGDAVAGEEGE
ncbi:ATP-dependent DNA helicase [Aeropyrum pernix]|uniref:ATP-dependent DNA helicase Hel308 n=1 Tax=Aeropyrum pernix TaxID=56636 RepID=A0A401HB21_AERPX|nr:DEAD/DEAH box helicase [Aeropyrum pernix]GBF09562.1 ATP-dependent DNA helicase [Aeropyrum pernix]